LRYLFLFLVLVGFWVVLSGQVDLTKGSNVYLLTCGVLSSALATWLAWRTEFLKDEGNVVRILIGQVVFLPWLFVQTVKANVHVARHVWSPRSRKRLQASLLTTPNTLKSDLATTIYANCITLTPGTVTVRVDTDTRSFLICALDEASSRGLKDMHDRLKKVEGED
jgi:multicomponent Na+:H+ antiporter subunit E